MFGGARLYRHGKMFGLVFDDTADLKVDETNWEKYEEAGSAPFKPFADRPTMVSYFEGPPDIWKIQMNWLNGQQSRYYSGETEISFPARKWVGDD